jgi:hypothetical protein
MFKKNDKKPETDLTQDRDNWGTLVNTVTVFLVP